jgi:nucleoside-diphosphate-sugar epimerase
MNRNILVTGGFGFVGGHLIDLLTKADSMDRIHVIDNLSSNPIPHELLLAELGERPNLTYNICSMGYLNEISSHT